MSGDRLAGPLSAAFSGALPGAALPPGPRTNRWDAVAETAAPGIRLAELLDALWHPGDVHRLPGGAPTSIRRRPVPSAGGCYPVQTHVVSADGTRYAFDHERMLLRRRDAARDIAAGWPAHPRTGDSTRLVFTVLPGRTFGRYRHRAWPLWIADAAYAVAAVRFLLGGRSGSELLGPSAPLRALLGVPPAADSQAWMRRGLAPEIPLAAVAIGAESQVRPERRRALQRRRSPEISEFLSRAQHAPPPASVEAVARASGQSWVRGAAAVSSWSVPSTASVSDLGTALWRTHLAAADLGYHAALSGGPRTRAISGFTPDRDPARWILHAVAVLPASGDHS